MTESLFYYFLAFNVSVVFVLACLIIVSDIRSRRELRKWDETRAVSSDVTQSRDHKTAASDSDEARQENSSRETLAQTLDRVEKFQRELNQQVIDLEKER